MEISNVTDLDGKFLGQLRNILKLTVKEMKFSLGELKVVDETVQWFDGFIDATANVQRMEHEAKKKTETINKKTEGLESLKIKDMQPGTFPARKATKSKAKAKSVKRKR